MSSCVTFVYLFISRNTFTNINIVIHVHRSLKRFPAVMSKIDRLSMASI